MVKHSLHNFKLKIKIFFEFIFSKNNFSLYMSDFRNNLKGFLKIIIILIPVCIILWVIIKALYGKCNTKHNKDTLPLKIYKKVIGVSIIPIRNFISQYISFFRSYMHLVTIMVILWLLNFNLLTIIVEFFAYYFYFVLTYDLSTLYIQFGKLFIDLQAIFLHIPLWLIILIVIAFLYRFRIKLAKAKLRHMEARNCGFINELSIVSMACGSMGKKKTKEFFYKVQASVVSLFRKGILNNIYYSDENNDENFVYIRDNLDKISVLDPCRQEYIWETILRYCMKNITKFNEFYDKCPEAVKQTTEMKGFKMNCDFVNDPLSVDENDIIKFADDNNAYHILIEYVKSLSSERRIEFLDEHS